MASVNKVFLLGNLTRDPELKHLPSGKSLCSFGIATNRKSGDYEEVCFADVTVFGNQAEPCSQYLKKGSQAHVGGRLRTEQWTKDGKQYSKLSVIAEEVTFLGAPKGGKPYENSDDIPF